MIALHRPSVTGVPTLTGAAVAVLLLVAACASGNSAKTATGATAGAGSPAAATAMPSTPTATGITTVGVRSGQLGSYLVDGAGRALYRFTSDGSNASSCKGTCLIYWPALTSAGKPVAAAGVDAALLATFAGPGGARWVSYAGHPLYYFALDKAAGDTKGQGLNDFGAKWWLVAPSGKSITGGPPASSAGYSGGGYGGYGG
jgi:predicted lipoprotein with Yx(FWY)xxD motif